ncbi:Imm52 family immunity protein [Melittangium boletus]|uniref:Imm52 family immunity protein n=1 Tax=Melittangium boletus TaxID=83453 RepID=UPI003DA39374
MSESYVVGAYWACRPEQAEDCARRAETFFKLMAECHPSFARWFLQNSATRDVSSLQFDPTRERFLELFGKKKYQSGNDGFHMGAWTGHVDRTQGGMVMMRCGSKAQVAPNHVRLFLPEEVLGHERMLTASVLSKVMKALAVSWEPDWAIATADGLWERLSQDSHLGCFVGWLTYLASQRGEVPELPAPVSTHPVEDKGTLILLGPDRLTPSNPAQVALAQRVQSQLESKGLLKRVVEPRALQSE